MANVRAAEARFDQLVARHSPHDWRKFVEEQRLRRALTAFSPIPMMVVSADIRKSTLLMKEAVKFQEFAETLHDFIEYSSKQVRNSSGWFDKFTGDGFLAFWIYKNAMEEVAHELFHACSDILEYFNSETLPSFRSNVRNMPAETGLAFGIDAGPSVLANIGGQVTVIGPAAVGSVRMQSVAHVGEIVFNVYPGEALYDDQQHFLEEHNLEIRRECRPTKEYASQEVYPAVFHGSYRRGHAAEGD